MRARVRPGTFFVAAILVALALAFFVGPEASSEPDGLNRVAIDAGFDGAKAPHAFDDLPTAGYAVRGVDDDGLSTGLAGVIGVGLTLALTTGVFALVRRRQA